MTRLTTPTSVRNRCFSDKNSDIALISNDYILRGENQFIRTLLGEALYQLVLTENDAETLSAANETLLTDYIVPCLDWITYYIALPQIQFQSSAFGVMEYSGNSANSSIDGYNNLRIFARENYEALRDILIEFLYENKTDYPLWTQPNKGNSTGNIFFTDGIFY